MAGIASALDWRTTQTQSAVVNTAVGSPPAVIVTDVDGFPVPGVTVSWAVASGGGGIVVANAITDAQGISALTSWTLGATPGTNNNSVTATVAGTSGSPRTFTASAVAASAVSIQADSATQQVGSVGAEVTLRPRVKVLSAQGGAAGVPVTFAVTAGGGSILGSTVILSDANGLAVVPGWILGTLTGVNTLTATATGLTGSPVTFTATGAALAATSLTANSTLIQSAQVSTAVAAAPSAFLSDVFGNPALGQITFTVIAGGGSIAPSNGTLDVDAAGIATLTSWTVGSGVGTGNNVVEAVFGTTTLVFTASGLAGPPPPPAVSIVANSSVSLSGPVGVAVTPAPSVLIRDSSLVGVAGVPVQWVITAGQGAVGSASTVTNGSGIATVPSWVLGAQPGTNTMEARAAGLTGNPVVFTATATGGGGAQFGGAYSAVVHVPGINKVYASGGGSTVFAGSPNVVRSLDAATRRHLADITVGTVPAGMVVAPDVGGRGEKVYVALTAGNVVVVNPLTDAVVTTITVAGAWSRGVYVAATDRVVFVQASGGAAIAINPTTDAQSTLIASSLSIGWIAHSPVAGNLYIPRTGGVLGVYNATTGALVTTVSGLSSSTTGIAYAPGTVDSVWVAGGSSRLLDPITTATNVRRTAVSTGTADTTSGLLYAPDTGLLYAGHTAAGLVPNEILEVDPETDTLLRRDPTIMSFNVEAGSGVETLGGWMPSSLAFWVNQGTRLYLWHAPSRANAVRTLITASQAASPQVTVSQGQPFAAGDLVTLRRNVQGSYRVRLDWPAQIAAANGLRRERTLLEPELRGERNYALNPWARDWVTPRVAPGWVFPSPPNVLHEFRWHGRDTNTWTTFGAIVDGTHTSTSTLNLRGMTPGDVLEPGDRAQVSGGWIVSRGVVDGTGRVSVLLRSLTNASDGAAANIFRPTVPDWIIPGQGVAIVSSGGPNAFAGASALVPVPFFQGLTSLWLTVEYWLRASIAGSITPSTAVRARVLLGGTAVSTTFSTDTTQYVPADGLVGPFAISVLHTMTGPEPVELAFEISGDDSSGAAAYIRRVQATLGPEPDILPAFEFNASSGALFHAGQRSLRDRGANLVAYTAQAIEDGIRLVPGARAELRHAAQGIAATPRILSVQRTIDPRSDEPDQPVIQLDNLPPSLARRLSRSGVS